MAFQTISKIYFNILMAKQFWHFFRILFAKLADWVPVFNKLALYLKNLKFLPIVISALKSVVSSFE